MSDNSINMEKVAKKLAAKIADLQYQVAQLETLAETFKEQKDKARNDLANALQQIHSLQNISQTTTAANDVIQGETVEPIKE